MISLARFQLKPNSSRCYFERARTALCSSLSQDAMHDLNSAIATDPKNADAYALRGQVTPSMKQRVKDITLALQYGKPTDNLYALRAMGYEHLHQDRLAVVDYTNALNTLSSDDTMRQQYLEARSRVRLRQGDHTSALRDVEEALQRKSRSDEQGQQDTAGLLYLRGYIELKMGNYLGAIESFTRHIKVGEAVGELITNAYQWRAIAYRASGKTRLAEKDTQTFKRLQEEYRNAGG